MNPNSTSLFDDDELFPTSDDKDGSHDEIREIIKARLPAINTSQPQPLDFWKELGHLKSGSRIETPPIQKEHDLDGHIIKMVEPGFVNVMNAIAGNNWSCSSSQYFDLSKEALVYECMPYAKNDMNVSLEKELELKPEDGKWLVSPLCAEDKIEEIYDFACNLFKASENQKYNVFAICSLVDEKATSFKNEEMGLTFLGVYALDRKRSFVQRRLIFHQVSVFLSI